MSVARQQRVGPSLRRAPRLDLNRALAIRALVIVALFAFAFFALPELIGIYWVIICTGVAIYSVVALGAGLLYGRVGMVSLCQIALLAVGAWVAARLFYGTGIPFPIVLLIAGVVTAVIGTLVGLPALRISGLHLALITLMFAGAITVVLNVIHFPNGGTGFLGVLPLAGSNNMRRPSIAMSDPAYYRYTLIVAGLMFLLALWQIAGKSGRAWAAIRESEQAAAAGGVDTTRYKLWAFMFASFITGVAGGLLGPSSKQLVPLQFPTQESIVLLAVILMGGIFSIWGAILAGVLYKLVPALLDSWGVSYFVLLFLFGAGILQVLATAPGGLVEQVPKDLARLGRLIARAFRKPSRPTGTA